ncbi:hypothetical protein GCM10027022_09800 [Alpinimonas psychrophila]
MVSGYIGGEGANPSYEEVCTGLTGHVEAVAVTFDPAVIPDQVILDVFFSLHDPTQLNRQGNDVGTQYRSAMFPADDAQRELFEKAIALAATWWDAPVVTTIEPLGAFYEAEEYHQDFFARNPGQGYCLAVALPKVNKIRKSFAPYIKD